MIESVLTAKNCKIKTKITIKSLISVGLVVLAIALPQLIHIAFGASGGITWMPMYLPVLIGGCLLGRWWGLGIGIASPIFSYLFTLAFTSPMPALERLPFMIFELAIFALICGSFSKSIAKNKWMAFPAVLFAQIGGRVAFIAASAIIPSSLSVSLVWTQVQTGLLGLFVQAAIVPLIIIGLQTLLSKDKKHD